jgi:hypothetical protein
MGGGFLALMLSITLETNTYSVIAVPAIQPNTIARFTCDMGKLK